MYVNEFLNTNEVNSDVFVCKTALFILHCFEYKLYVPYYANKCRDLLECLIKLGQVRRERN